MSVFKAFSTRKNTNFCKNLHFFNFTNLLINYPTGFANLSSFVV